MVGWIRDARTGGAGEVIGRSCLPSLALGTRGDCARFVLSTVEKPLRGSKAGAQN